MGKSKKKALQSRLTGPQQTSYRALLADETGCIQHSGQESNECGLAIRHH